jgi:hypothetical protein
MPRSAKCDALSKNIRGVDDRFSLRFVFVITPNLALQTVSATLTVVPIQHVRICEGSSVQLADSAVLFLVQCIIDIAVRHACSNRPKLCNSDAVWVARQRQSQC